MPEEVASGAPPLVLLVGPPGDRLRAAEAIARARGGPLHRVDLTGVYSRYIGETEKNLGRVLEAADERDAVLLLDEADALFGRRTEVREGDGRSTEREMGLLLGRAARHTGAVVLGVGEVDALDPAVLRRLTGARPPDDSGEESCRPQPDSPHASASRRKERRRSSGS